MNSFAALKFQLIRKLVVLLILATDVLAGQDLFAHYSQNGIRGDVQFISNNEGARFNSSFTIRVDLRTLMDTEQGLYNWAMYDLPVEYTKPIMCDPNYLGEKILDMTQSFGQVVLPVNTSIEFQTHQLNLTESHSSFFWGKTLVFEGPSVLCATIMPTDGLKTVAAKLPSPIAGTVTIMTWSDGDHTDTKIVTDLYHVVEIGSASRHIWKLYVTDVLDSRADRERGDCNALQLLYDPDSRSGEGCSPLQPDNCKQGDLSGRLGLVRAESAPGSGFGGGSRRVFRDPMLTLPNLNGPRSLYVVLFDKENPEVVLTCGQFREQQPRKSQALFGHKGVRGEILFEQRSHFDATRVLVNLTGLSGLAGGFHVHEYPVPIPKTADEAICSATAKHYNPWGWDPSNSPPPGRGTGELYELGDLSGKFGMLTGLSILENDVVDTTLPLFGPFSINGRGLVIHLASGGSRWVCTNVQPLDVKMTTAMAIFRYPLGGRIIFRQYADDPFSETMIYVESLVYSDGSLNSTTNHQFEIHSALPNEDYHDWQNRCRSVGSVYNPFKVSNKSDESCNTNTQRRCFLGDLTEKHGRLSVAGLSSQVSGTKRFFTDVNLPLFGTQSIVGRSIVIIDDNSPKQRGNRLACTPVTYYHRHKAVVKDWFGNGFSSPVEGKVELVQETEFSSSSIQMDFTGLGGEAGRFGVHEAPVKANLQFPCTEEALGLEYNPLNVSSAEVKGSGTSDQYPIGDLSSRFGKLAGFEQVHTTLNDTNLPLYGTTSVVGRSFVFSRDRDNERWTCGTFGWGFAPSEAKEIRAIASFHHPGGFAFGYIRMSQVVYHDGSATDTIVEVNLKHPGKQNSRISRDHRWAIYVNPVGVDAAVASPAHRCVAAGFVWNPAFVQLTDPRNNELYQRECQPHVPYRCMVGDISGRLGNVDIGAGSYIFSDRNLPLSGKFSVMGRSAVMMSPNGGEDRFACANIEPDNDIFKFVVIRKPRKFVASTFVDDVRRVLGAPSWMLLVDSRETRDIQFGRCVQFKIHFYGPQAQRMEQDLTHLLSKGQLDAPSIQVRGSHPDPKRPKTIPYHVCDGRDSSAQRPSNHATHVTLNLIAMLPLIFLNRVLLH